MQTHKINGQKSSTLPLENKREVKQNNNEKKDHVKIKRVIKNKI